MKNDVPLIPIRNVSTYVNISGGTIGSPGLGGTSMGNVYGGGSGFANIVRCGLVLGNTNVNISQAEGKTTSIYHSVYGGGAYGSVGDFDYHTDYETITGVDVTVLKVKGIESLHTPGTGNTYIDITGGTIGDDGYNDGMVFGSSRGDVGKPNTRPDWGAWVNDTHVTIGEPGANYDTPIIKGSVYGSGENGHTLNNTVVTVNSGTIGIPMGAPVEGTDTIYYGANYPNRGNVYGGGCGTDTYIEDGVEKYNPQGGIVRGNTRVNINGGLIARSVYGAGSMGSVGTITNATDTTSYYNKETEKYEYDKPGIAKHADATKSFALSWPYEFKFKEGTGTAMVNITGGHIGVQCMDNGIEIKGDGDVYGSARGEAGDRYTTAHLAYVRKSVVNVNYPENPTQAAIGSYQNFDVPCVTGSVHGSGENGYVYEDTEVTLNKGLIGHSLYGAGKGKGTYKVTLKKIAEPTAPVEYYTDEIYSLIAGKVFGNTTVTMYDGFVGRNVYGGGNMASVGKGNYAAGPDDYYPAGYGETLYKTDNDGNVTWSENLWDEVHDNSKAFLGSGKTTVKVLGGTVGYITADPSQSFKNGLPTGNVFGGSAGEAAANVKATLSPRYYYTPAFFSGYVNETDVTIGGGNEYRCKASYGEGDDAHAKDDHITDTEYEALPTAEQDNWEKVDPRILASVYGGGQDGHVRRDTKVTVYSGEIGLAYENTTNRSVLGDMTKADGSDNEQLLHRGNVYGAGSGISKYKFKLNGVEDFEPTKIDGYTYKKEDYSTSAGSVTRFTNVNILGGTIHRNVYGGGSLASIGPLKVPGVQDYDPYKPGQADIPGKTPNGPGRQSLCSVVIGGAGSVYIGTPNGYNVMYGGEVYGASRGQADTDYESYSTSFWTKVLVKNGAHILGNVFGGGDNGMVKKDTEVQIGE